jgi:polyphosphate kinase
MIKEENIYINRELSWLRFNERVLQESYDKSVPLVERLRFLGIFSNNLDEFFKVRYATVKRIVDGGKELENKLKLERSKELLDQITKIVIDQQNRSLKILIDIENELNENNIFVLNEKELSESQAAYVSDYFINNLSNILVTIILNELTDFPILKDSAAYLAVKMTLNEGKSNNRYALIEIPREIDRVVVLPSEGAKQYLMLVDDIIRFNLGKIFSMFSFSDICAHMIKITRDAELDLDNDVSKSFIQKLYHSVEDRKISNPVRFVYDRTISEDTLEYLKAKMHVENTDSIIPGGRYHNRRDYISFPSLGKKELTYEPIQPLLVKGIKREGSLIVQIAEKDFLQYTPYHTFSYITRFLKEAALDPGVKDIKITIYRLAKNSQVVSSLINAVKNGKNVTVLIELQARFDEHANISYAELLQKEGVNVIFGVKGLKVHSKICVIERQEGRKLMRYGFISTGNFNESTAKVYTDYTMFTANQSILKEVSKVFEFLDTPYKLFKYKHLLVSPHTTKKGFRKLIDHEIANAKAGKKAGVYIKLNSLTSYKMVDKLYEASKAGVKVQLIIRGNCCLIPGLPGISENIEAISIVDKFLEHPRLLIFENDGDQKVYISSADWMTRNLDNRVEVSCPVYDKDVKQELIDTFNISWKDNVKARVLIDQQISPYKKPKKGQKAFRSQMELYNYYKNRLDSN